MKKKQENNDYQLFYLCFFLNKTRIFVIHSPTKYALLPQNYPTQPCRKNCLTIEFQVWKTTW